MGYFFAVLTSILFTAYALPRKLAHQSAERYSLFQGIGYFFGCAAFYIVHCLTAEKPETLTDPNLLLSALSGIFWYCGCLMFFMAIDEMGLTSSNQWKNLQGPFGAAFNLLFLAEYRNTNVWLIVLSSALILVSALFLTLPGKDKRQVSRKGLVCALVAAVLFGLNSMLLKNGTNHGLVYSQQAVQSFGVFASSAVYLLVKEKSLACLKGIGGQDNLLGLLGGFIFSFALYFSLRAYSLLPGSVTFTIIQLNAVWTVLAGVFIFREADFRKNRVRIIAGLLFALCGVAALMNV